MLRAAARLLCALLLTATAGCLDTVQAPDLGLVLDAPAGADPIPWPDLPPAGDAPPAPDRLDPLDGPGPVDGPVPVDQGGIDGGGDGGMTSQCPAPPVVTPEDLPAGYLPPETVTLAEPVDGDTARFLFPTQGQQTARFLFVNTEESFGAQTTDFGIMTKAIVAGFLNEATEVVIAVREDRIAGMPDLDPYDRWLSLIFVDGELLQTRIIREGWSAYYTQFGCAPAPVHQSLLYAEAEANAAQRGIWAPGHPTDYSVVLPGWIGTQTCRPNPYEEPYCP